MEYSPPWSFSTPSRPIDQHLKGFAALGAEVEIKNGYMCAETEGGRLKGSQIYLDVEHGLDVGALERPMPPDDEGIPLLLHLGPHLHQLGGDALHVLGDDPAPKTAICARRPRGDG